MSVIPVTLVMFNMLLEMLEINIPPHTKHAKAKTEVWHFEWLSEKTGVKQEGWKHNDTPAQPPQVAMGWYSSDKQQGKKQET